MTGRSLPADRRLERAVRLLARALAAGSRGSTLVIQAPQLEVADPMRRRRPEVEPLTLGKGHELPRTDRRFGTVMLVGVLDALSDEEGGRLLARAWELVAEGGRLSVTVANRDGAERDPRPPFGRRELTRALRGFGEPSLATDQPYRWLTMYVVKQRPRRVKPPNRTRRDRFRVTARLCRGRVIELGCGEGHLAGAVSSRGHDVVGVDISRAKIETARRRFPDIEFRACDIAELTLPDQSFDTAILAEVLEHVDDVAGAALLATAWRLIRPGGRLVVSVPNEDCIPHRNHVRRFDRRQLRELLRPLGRPRLITEQPYKWLLMYVDKP